MRTLQDVKSRLARMLALAPIALSVLAAAGDQTSPFSCSFKPSVCGVGDDGLMCIKEDAGVPSSQSQDLPSLVLDVLPSVIVTPGQEVTIRARLTGGTATQRASITAIAWGEQLLPNESCPGGCTGAFDVSTSPSLAPAEPVFVSHYTVHHTSGATCANGMEAAVGRHIAITGYPSSPQGLLLSPQSVTLTVSCSTFSVSPSHISVAPGGTSVALRALDNGVLVTDGVHWPQSPTPVAEGDSIGTVSVLPDGTALYTPPLTLNQTVPQAVIPVTRNGVAASVAVVLTNNPVAVRVTPSIAVLNAGDSLQLAATVTNDSSSHSFTWTIAPSSSAVVLSGGTSTTQTLSISPVYQPSPPTSPETFTVTATDSTTSALVGTAVVSIATDATGISGIVSYYGTRRGTTYVACADGDDHMGPRAGTVALTPAFSGTVTSVPFRLHGVGCSSSVTAWMDSAPTDSPGTHAFVYGPDPSGSASIGPSRSVNITMIDHATPPTTHLMSPPAITGLFPADGHMVVTFSPYLDSNNNTEWASAYRVYFDTSASELDSETPYVEIPAGAPRIAFIKGLTPGDSYYFAVLATKAQTGGTTLSSDELDWTDGIEIPGPTVLSDAARFQSYIDLSDVGLPTITSGESTFYALAYEADAADSPSAAGALTLSSSGLEPYSIRYLPSGLQTDGSYVFDSLFATVSAVTADGTTPPSVIIDGFAAVSGVLDGDHEVELQIVVGGALGTAELRWKIDAGPYTSSIVIPESGDVSLGSSGLDAHFSSGTYSSDNVYTFTTGHRTPRIYDLSFQVDQNGDGALSLSEYRGQTASLQAVGLAGLPFQVPHGAGLLTTSITGGENILDSVHRPPPAQLRTYAMTKVERTAAAESKLVSVRYLAVAGLAPIVSARRDPWDWDPVPVRALRDITADLGMMPTTFVGTSDAKTVPDHTATPVGAITTGTRVPFQTVDTSGTRSSTYATIQDTLLDGLEPTFSPISTAGHITSPTPTFSWQAPTTAPGNAIALYAVHLQHNSRSIDAVFLPQGGSTVAWTVPSSEPLTTGQWTFLIAAVDIWGNSESFSGMVDVD